MVKNKSFFSALLRKNYLNIKNHRKQIIVFVCLAFLCLGQIWLALPSRAVSLWDSQLGKQEIGTSFGASNGTPASATSLIIYIIQYLLTFFGLLMVIIIIWAGSRWMTAGGDEKKVETAKKHLTSAVIGGVVIIAAYVITYFVEETARKMITNSIW